MSTVRPSRQHSLRMIGNERQIERFFRSWWPASSVLKSFSQNATVSSSDALSSPSRFHASSVVSTMKVEWSLS
jgi:hypothetical protein